MNQLGSETGCNFDERWASLFNVRARGPRGLFNINILQLCVSALIRRIDRKKDKTERKILDSQERAFWDVHRPVVRVWGGLMFKNEIN